MAAPIKHGTEAGYTQHRRTGVPMCAPCRLANNQAALERQQETERRRRQAEEEALVKGRILTRMALAYPAVYERIRQEELRRRSLERASRREPAA